MNHIQEEIAKALVQLSEKSLVTEAAVAKKIRENLKLNGKNKAGLAFQDIEEAVFYIEENNDFHFALHLNSANDILIKQNDVAAGLDADSRKRRLASQKSMSILTNGDVKNCLENEKSNVKAGKSDSKKNGPKPYKKRTDKFRMDVNRIYEDWE